MVCKFSGQLSASWAGPGAVAGSSLPILASERRFAVPRPALGRVGGWRAGREMVPAVRGERGWTWKSRSSGGS